MARDFTSGNTEFFKATSSPILSYPCTIAAWFRKDVSGGALNICNVVNDGSSTERFALSITADSPFYLEARDLNQTSALALTTTAPSINTWHHGIATFAASNRRDVYLDNGASGSNSQTSNVVPANFNATVIGRFGDSTPNWEFDGLIAEVGIYNSVISEDSRAMLAAGVSPLLVEPGSLVFYAPLMHPSGNENDLMGGLVLTDNNTVAAGIHPRIIRPSGQLLTPTFTIDPVSGFQAAWAGSANVMVQ